MLLPEKVFDPGQTYIEHCFRVSHNKHVFLLVDVSVDAQTLCFNSSKNRCALSQELCFWTTHTLFQRLKTQVCMIQAMAPEWSIQATATPKQNELIIDCLQHCNHSFGFAATTPVGFRQPLHLVFVFRFSWIFGAQHSGLGRGRFGSLESYESTN